MWWKGQFGIGLFQWGSDQTGNCIHLKKTVLRMIVAV